MKQFLEFLKPHRWFLFILLLFTVVRFSFVTKGHLYWIDELRFLNTSRIIEEAENKELKRAASLLFNAHGRPGYILLSLIPAGLQHFAETKDWISIENDQFFTLLKQGRVSQQFNPQYFNIAAAFNVVVSLLSLFFFYCLLRKLVADKRLVPLGTLIYAGLVNTNFYIRHLFPYDLSLMFFLWALFLVVIAWKEEAWSKRRLIFIGILTGLGFTIYPTYYLFCVIVGATLLMAAPKKIFQTFIFILGFACVIGVFEGLAQWSGNSFLYNCWKLSGSAIQGSFDEGFVFPFVYMYDVEGLLGIVLLGLFLTFLIFSIWKEHHVIKVIFLTAVLGIFYHGMMGVCFKKAVFYGRIMHMYIPFLVIGSMKTLELISMKRWQNILLGGILILSLGSFAQFVNVYSQQMYPSDLHHKYTARLNPGTLYKTHEHTSADQRMIERALAISVNAIHLHPIFEHHYPFKTPRGFNLIATTLHPLSYAPYQYEGHGTEDRKRLRSRQYTMRIYVRHLIKHLYE